MTTLALPELKQLGPYTIIEKIAEGGMGMVFKAQKIGQPTILAIKVLPAEMARNRVLMKRFEQEFRAASALDHPNIVKAIDYNGSPPHPYLVMEYVNGTTLGQKIEDDGAFEYQSAIGIIGQICEGLHAAHKQGLIHRDVKPDNVLVTAKLVAKLTDLGLVRDIDSDDNLTRTGRGLGTPYYMAPEQFRNAKSVDVRSDIYSIGATLYVLVTGKVPFDKCSPLDCWMKKSKDDFPTPKMLVPNLPSRVDKAIRRAMCADPAKRPTSCREFMEDLIGESWRLRSTPQGNGPGSGLHADVDLWYVVFYENLQPKTVKGNTEAVRKNIRLKALGDLGTVLVSRTKAGPFVPLRQVPEFRDASDFLGSLPPETGSKTQLSTTQFTEPITEKFATAQATRQIVDQTPLPEKLVRPGQIRHKPLTDRTDELPTVPVTNSDTLSVGTDERPKLATQSRIKPQKTMLSQNWFDNASPTRNSFPVWAIVLVLLAATAGLLVGLMLR